VIVGTVQRGFEITLTRFTRPNLQSVAGTVFDGIIGQVDVTASYQDRFLPPRADSPSGRQSAQRSRPLLRVASLQGHRAVTLRSDDCDGRRSASVRMLTGIRRRPVRPIGHNNNELG
jgi:hypothetical protein